MTTRNYEELSVVELRQLANERKIPIPGGIRSMRGISSDPYAEQGRRDLIAELKSMDAHTRERRQDRIVMITLVAAVLSALVSVASLVVPLINQK